MRHCQSGIWRQRPSILCQAAGLAPGGGGLGRRLQADCRRRLNNGAFPGFRATPLCPVLSRQVMTPPSSPSCYSGLLFLFATVPARKKPASNQAAAMGCKQTAGAALCHAVESRWPLTSRFVTRGCHPYQAWLGRNAVPCLKSTASCTSACWDGCCVQYKLACKALAEDCCPMCSTVGSVGSVMAVVNAMNRR